MTEAPYELSAERYIDAPPETVWQVMTERLLPRQCEALGRGGDEAA